MRTPNTLPNLGSQPDDPLIVDLVQVNPVSVRLRNAICRAARSGALPIQRVSEYLSLGEGDRELLMLRLPDVGRKSVDELSELITRINDPEDGGEDARRVAADFKEVRLALCDCFSEVSVRDGLGQVVLPTRLVHALGQTGVGGERLSVALRDHRKMSLRLLRHPGVGKKTIEAWRDSLGEAVRDTMLASGLSVAAAHAAGRLVLEGAVAERSDEQAIAEVLPFVRRGRAVRNSGTVGEPTTSRSASLAVEDVAPSVDACIKTGLAKLDERTQGVIHRRRGLSGRRETLEQIGESLGVTRERVRQIEKKGTRTLKRLIGRRLPEAMQVRGGEHWKALVDSNDHLLTRDSEGGRDKLSPWFLLGLDVLGISVREWLDEFAHRVDGGWISPRWRIEDFDAMRRQLCLRLEATRLPCALSEVVKGQPRKMALAVVALSGFRTYGTYVVEDGRRITPRVRRALRLHAVLGGVGRCTPIVELAASYTAATPNDRCSTRDCEIVMRGHRHLFVEVLEGSWAALGRVGDVPQEGARVSVAREVGLQPRPYALGASTPQSGVWESIAAELGRTGPAPLGVLMRRARQFLPSGRSERSVGVSMSQRKDVFCRVLPGVYALHHQVPSATELLAAPPAYVLEEDQARLYALARRAGESWGAYPLWMPETEYLLCAWAQGRGKTELLDNLLAVARVDRWPDEIDRERWHELTATRSCFSLHFPMRTEALAAPGLDQVFAACLYVRDHGHFSWISGNRVLKRRVWEYWSAGLLAALVAMGALADGASDWQQPHLPGAGLDEVLARLEATHRKESELSWHSDIGRALVDRAIAASLGEGWVTRGVVRRVLRNLIDEGGAAGAASNPLDKLLAEKAEAKAADAREQLLRSLSASADGGKRR